MISSDSEKYPDHVGPSGTGMVVSSGSGGGPFPVHRLEVGTAAALAFSGSGAGLGDPGSSRVPSERGTAASFGSGFGCEPGS